MSVIIVGGGEVGTHLARLIASWGLQPTLIELHPLHLDGVRVVQGNGLDPEVLEAAGARQARILAAVTGSDEVNLTVAGLARFEFAVPRTVARVNAPRHAWAFQSAMGVDVALNQAEVLAHLVAEEANP